VVGLVIRAVSESESTIENVIRDGWMTIGSFTPVTLRATLLLAALILLGLTAGAFRIPAYRIEVRKVHPSRETSVLAAPGSAVMPLNEVAADD
jgi:hypothetical protein